MPLSFHRYLADLDTELDISFSYQNICVRTVGKKDLQKLWNEGKIDKNQKSEKYLLIEAYTEIEEFDSLLEGAANLRPLLLATLGLLSFITNEVFTIYDFNQIQNYLIRSIPKYQTPMQFIFGGIDKRHSLEKLLSFLNNSSNDRKELIYSLFDRYRKASSMANEDEEGMRYDDEIFLAYFHILELLAGQYTSELKGNIQNATKHFLTNLYKEVFLFDSGKASEESVGKQKILDQLLIHHVPVAAQICFMYKRLGLFSGKARQVIETYVKLRNDIAHGRSVYIQKLTFPLPPFFSQVKDIAHEIQTISLLAIRTIDAYLETDFYKADWDYFIKHQPNPLFEIKNFLKDKAYEQISVLGFKQGKFNGIKPWMLSYYYFNKKIKLPQVELALKAPILDLSVNKKNVNNYLHTLILLSDSADEELRMKCQEIIAEAYRRKYPETRARDYLKYYEYHHFRLNWFKEFVGVYLKAL